MAAFDCLKRWYHKVTGQPLHPTHEDTAQLQQERTKLYTCNNSLPHMFDLAPLAFPVEDSIPAEDEIEKALSCLKNGKSPGASGITVDQLKFWMHPKKSSSLPKLNYSTNKRNNYVDYC